MASTRFGKLSGASVAALLLLLAVLAGSFAPGAQAQDFLDLTVSNQLSYAVNCTIPPGLSLGFGHTFVVPAGGSKTERIDPFNAFFSELFLEVLGGHLAGSYATGGDGSQDGLLARVLFKTGPEVFIVEECFDYPDNSGLELVVGFDSDVEEYDYDALTFTICAPKI